MAAPFSLVAMSPTSRTGIIKLLLLPPLLMRADHSCGATFVSSHRQVRYDQSCKNEPARGSLILLPGGSGPDSTYPGQVKYFRQHGYCVYVIHYLDATGGPLKPSDSAYRTWAQVICDFLSLKRLSVPGSQVGLLGYSLGASVALVAATQGAAIRAVADWSGSLPDAFVESARAFPPLLIVHGTEDRVIPERDAEQVRTLWLLHGGFCDLRIYAHQGHRLSPSASGDADEESLHFFDAHLTP